MARGVPLSLYIMSVFTPKTDETVYAERIYDALVVRELGDMTAEKLQLPSSTHQRYREKTLYYKEAWALAALATLASGGQLRRVMAELEYLVQSKRSHRGVIDASPEQAMYAAFDSIEDLFDDRCKWGKRWLKEFRHDEDENFMLVPFADHWQRQFNALKSAIETTRK